MSGKKSQLEKLRLSIKKDLAIGLDRLYKDIEAKSAKYNANTIGTFVTEAESAAVHAYVSNKLGSIRTGYIQAVKSAENSDGKQYTESQAINMWSYIAGQIRHPQLMEMEKADVSHLSTGGSATGGSIISIPECVILFLSGLGIVGAILPYTRIPSILGLIFLAPIGAVLIGKVKHSGKDRSSNVDEGFLEKALNYQKGITLKILESWCDDIIEKALLEEPRR